MISIELKSKPYLKFALAGAAAWTLGAVVSLWWNLDNTHRAVVEEARVASRMAYEKDMVYRAWNSLNGGVYVPISEHTAPNPYLKNVTNRDLTTTGGLKLTLINPSYMNRQVYGLEVERTGSRGHLTSLDPIRPGNQPDPWEMKALKILMAGGDEYSEIRNMGGREFMRLMRPVVTEEGCVKCHEPREHEEDEFWGGMSVSIPMDPFRAAAVPTIKGIWFWHVATWIFGIGGILFSTSRLNDYYRRREADEKRIMESLREKDVLLREIHHRVKNNLQVISGMLELQASHTRDEGARTSLKEGRNRVMTMSLIHQKLYQSEDIAHIGMEGYIKGLVKDLAASYGADASGIFLEVEADPVTLDLDSAIPMGLIASELITNSLKYAFPAGSGISSPSIRICLRHTGDEEVSLEVSDNGVGLPEGFDPDRLGSLGLRLVHTMVEQMGGEIAQEGPPGVTWLIKIPLYQGAKPEEFIGDLPKVP